MMERTAMEYDTGKVPFGRKNRATPKPPRIKTYDVALLRSLPGTAILTSREAGAAANIGYARITLALRHGLLKGTRIEGRLGYRVTVQALADWVDAGAPVPTVLSDDDKAALLEVQESGRPDLRPGQAADEVVQRRPRARAVTTTKTAEGATSAIAPRVDAAPALPPAAEAQLAALAALPLPAIVLAREDPKSENTADSDVVASLRRRLLESSL